MSSRDEYSGHSMVFLQEAQKVPREQFSEALLKAACAGARFIFVGPHGTYSALEKGALRIGDCTLRPWLIYNHLVLGSRIRS